MLSVAALHPLESPSLIMGRGKHLVLGRGFAVRLGKHKSSPHSSHQTTLAAHLPPTPRNCLDSLHLQWEGIRWGLWMSEVLPISWGYAKDKNWDERQSQR